jgi:hypothetical protein
MFDEVDILLEKAAQNRPNDYRPHYYIGFNHLYFRNNSDIAAPHLRKASTYPNAPGFIKGLASRVSLYAGQTGTAIFFLSNIIEDTSDPKMLKHFERRLITLKMLFYLEEKAKEYTTLYGRPLKSLDDLIATGMVPELPVDPYGGKFILLKNGRIYTTSNMVNK